MALPALLYAAWRRLHPGPGPAGEHTRTEVRNPLSLRIAIQFAALYALVVLAVRWADHAFGGAGVYWASFLSGLTDLDAIALSVSQLEGTGNLAPASAARAILIAAGANSLLKGLLALSIGSRTLRPPVALVLGATVLLAALSAWFVA
jgi:uncharacterized membrane protein (DUF4010 family)